MSSHDEQSNEAEPWKQLYRSALLEIDTNLVLQRIDGAEKAINERAVELLTDASSKVEKESLANVLVVLSDLRRISLERNP